MRSSRDPDFPKSIRSRINAIQKSIDTLSKESLDSAGTQAAGEKISRAIFALEKHARTKEGINVDDLGSALWRKAIAAKERARENYSAGLRRELSESTERLREARRQEDPYTRELRLYGVGTRRGPARDARRSHRRRRR